MSKETIKIENSDCCNAKIISVIESRRDFFICSNCREVIRAKAVKGISTFHQKKIIEGM